MKRGDPYYDGPIEDSGRSMEELERDIEEERKRMEALDWPSEYKGE